MTEAREAVWAKVWDGHMRVHPATASAYGVARMLRPDERISFRPRKQLANRALA